MDGCENTIPVSNRCLKRTVVSQTSLRRLFSVPWFPPVSPGSPGPPSAWDDRLRFVTCCVRQSSAPFRDFLLLALDKSAGSTRQPAWPPARAPISVIGGCTSPAVHSVTVSLPVWATEHEQGGRCPVPLPMAGRAGGLGHLLIKDVAFTVSGDLLHGTCSPLCEERKALTATLRHE